MLAARIAGALIHISVAWALHGTRCSNWRQNLLMPPKRDDYELETAARAAAMAADSDLPRERADQRYLDSGNAPPETTVETVTPEKFKEGDEEALVRVALPESNLGRLKALHNVPIPGQCSRAPVLRSCDSVVRRDWASHSG
jgi:hypothetical protein